MPTLGDYQVAIGDFIIGAGTGYEIDTDGLEGMDMPGLRTSDVERALDHGERSGRDLLEGRTFAWTLNIIGGTPAVALAALEALERVTVPRSSEVEVSYKLPGRTQRVLYARPRRRKAALDRRAVLNGIAEVSLEFHASDPRIYSATDNTVTIPVSFAAGGGGGTATSWPWSWPHSWLVEADPELPPPPGSGTIQVNNAGTFDAPWVGRFEAGTGSVQGPRLENVTTGEVLDFTALVLTPGQWLDLNSNERTALLNGEQSRYGTLSSTSRWFNLSPGINDMRAVARSPDTGATFRLTYRSAYG